MATKNRLTKLEGHLERKEELPRIRTIVIYGTNSTGHEYLMEMYELDENEKWQDVTEKAKFRKE